MIVFEKRGVGEFLGKMLNIGAGKFSVKKFLFYKDTGLVEVDRVSMCLNKSGVSWMYDGSSLTRSFE